MRDALKRENAAAAPKRSPFQRFNALTI